MTALARALEWFIAPDPRAAAPVRYEDDPLLDLHLSADETPASNEAQAHAATSSLATAPSATVAPPLAAPVARTDAAFAAPTSAAPAAALVPPRSGAPSAAVAPPLAAPSAAVAPPVTVSAPPLAAPGASVAAFVAPMPTSPVSPFPAAPRGGVSSSDEPFAVTSAAVLGRPQDVGPMAAGVALALRRETRAKVASVVVLGELPRDLGAGGSGGPAGRRIAARLEALGLAPVIRGRLVWVALDPRLPQLATAVRRVTLVAAPAVLAVTAARTAAMDEALAEQDLVVLVTADPSGALAKAAEVGLPPGMTRVAAPLDRNPARALARAGVRAPAAAKALLGEGRR